MAEYIEREAAIERLEKLFQLQASTARAIIEAIPAADVQPVRWIPVTERLPKDGVYVLAYSADDDYMCVEARHRFAAFQITHWMPLPPPPKGEE